MIKISENKWINPANWIIAEVVEGNLEVTMVSGKRVVITDQSLIQAFFGGKQEAQVINMVSENAGADRYQVLKKFRAMNNQKEIPAGILLDKKMIDGKLQWVWEKDPLIMFDYQNVSNLDFFAPVFGEQAERIITTPNTFIKKLD